MADIEAKPHGNVSVAGLREETTWGRLIKRIQLQPQPGSEGKWTNADVFYWTNDATAPGNLRLGSSLWSMGLSWKLVLVTIALGHAIMTIALTFNGVIGARFHIPYTIQSRASFGFYFSFAMVVVRMIVAAFWYVGQHYHRDDDSYFIYFVVILPFHWIHPRDLRWFFALQSLLLLPAILGMVIWACKNTGGGTDNPVFNRGNTSKGAALGWTFMSGMNAMMGNYGTLAVNINDFTRYAKKPQMTYVQLFIIPAWDPLKIMNNWNGSSQARAGAVFAAAALLFGQMGANIGANCISAANDLNAMFPKYINLRRGQYVIAFIGAWALMPWNILSSAEALLNCMDSYTIWLAPITGVLLADFWLTHGRHYEVHELGAKHMYSLGYLYGILTSFFLYVVLSRVWKP
ncbi:NCS1 nucleoside transporter family [Phyllosticta citricarpa]|uniref:NCS1 nucleoside transporter family n=1 Tax=Phyllosticta citricarpa TaxID=55181 RepID=A0ABR1M6E2_9PEZI